MPWRAVVGNMFRTRVVSVIPEPMRSLTAGVGILLATVVVLVSVRLLWLDATVHEWAVLLILILLLFALALVRSVAVLKGGFEEDSDDDTDR